MTCREWRRRFLEYQNTKTESPETAPLPEDLAEHPRECARCRTALAALASVSRPDPRLDAVPASLAGDIMSAVRGKNGRVRYHRFPWPVLALPLGAVAGLIGILLLAVPRPSPDRGTVTVTLILRAPEARTVTVAGDWNAWSADRQRLRDPDGDGVWEITVQLEKNHEYRYQFIINGESWIPDPLAPLHVDDGFGGINSVLDI